MQPSEAEGTKDSSFLFFVSELGKSEKQNNINRKSYETQINILAGKNSAVPSQIKARIDGTNSSPAQGPSNPV
jgi:hypothetical protein